MPNHAYPLDTAETKVLFEDAERLIGTRPLPDTNAPEVLAWFERYKAHWLALLAQAKDAWEAQDLRSYEHLMEESEAVDRLADDMVACFPDDEPEDEEYFYDPSDEEIYADYNNPESAYNLYQSEVLASAYDYD